MKKTYIQSLNNLSIVSERAINDEDGNNIDTSIGNLQSSKQNSIDFDKSGNSNFYLSQKGTWENVGQGPRGSTGPIGQTGPRGFCGPQGSGGLPGFCGPKGETGSRGNTGSCGPLGTTGPSGYTGFCGPMGDSGNRGSNSSSQGQTGDQGPQGDRGETTTTQGNPGAKGVCGPRGSNSTTAGGRGGTGPNGYTGFCGPMGNQGGRGLTGNQGNTGFCGPRGDTGATGATGPAGARTYVAGSVKATSGTGWVSGSETVAVNSGEYVLCFYLLNNNDANNNVTFELDNNSTGLVSHAVASMVSTSVSGTLIYKATSAITAKFWFQSTTGTLTSNSACYYTILVLQ